MENQAIIQSLSTAQFFTEFSENELAIVASISKIRNIESGEIIFSELSPAHSLFFLNKEVISKLGAILNIEKPYDKILIIISILIFLVAIFVKIQFSYNAYKKN